jgi:hypothetical protein
MGLKIQRIDLQEFFSFRGDRGAPHPHAGSVVCRMALTRAARRCTHAR